MDLGYKDSLVPTPAGKPEEKTRYPDFTVRGDSAKQLIKETKLMPGEEAEGSIRVRLKRVSHSADDKDSYGNSVEFEVLSCNGLKKSEEKEPDGDDDSEADKAEEKMLGYKRPKPKKEAAPVNPSELVE